MERKEIRGIIADVKEKGNDSRVFFPWDDVFASMLEKPEKVRVTDKVCPDCGANLVELYFSSPAWTWQSLCGRAGVMTICPGCPDQKDFQLHIMN